LEASVQNSSNPVRNARNAVSTECWELYAVMAEFL
jgi:hypothetical protein